MGAGATVILVLGYLQLRPRDAVRLGASMRRMVDATRAEPGCLHYAFGADLLDGDRLHIGERWVDRAAQATHTASVHMADFNVGMRDVKLQSACLESFENGVVRTLMEVPPVHFRPERHESAMVVVMGSARFDDGEIDRLMPDLVAQMAATQAEPGCTHYSFARDVLDPDLLLIAERWRDAEALDAHARSAHVKAFGATLRSARMQSIAVKAYDASGERTLVA